MPYTFNPFTGKLDYYIPSGSGPTGASGQSGTPGLDGNDGEDGFPIPGVAGVQGTQGIPGIPGSQGATVFSVGQDGDDGSDSFIPGPQGPQGPAGGGGGATITTVEVSLGTKPVSNGSFTIAGTFTVGKPVLITQAALAYTGKGTYTDEIQMDAITAGGYVANATTINCNWGCWTRVYGNVKFNYLVSA